MFANVLQQRSESLCYDFQFFEESLYLMRDMGLSMLPNDGRGVSLDVSQSSQPATGDAVETDLPLYEYVLRMRELSLGFSLSRSRDIAAIRSRSFHKSCFRTDGKFRVITSIYA